MRRLGPTLSLQLADGMPTLQKVGVFLNDTAGAFDRIEIAKLLAKLRRLGICQKLSTFFKDYVAPRTAQVALDGKLSSIFMLLNMVFQGTVFGPSIWNF